MTSLRLIVLLLFAFSACAHNISKDRMITYFFIGHSNMGGYCAEKDTVENGHVWFYNPVKGFYHGTDKNLSNNSGSCVMPFLKHMAALYPEYNFCGVKYSSNGMTAEDFLSEERHIQPIIDKIEDLQSKSTIAGLVLMFGFQEGVDSAQSAHIDKSIFRIITVLRTIAGNDQLPVIVNRYEENSMRREMWVSEKYHKWDKVIKSKIESLEKKDKYIKLAPFKPIPEKEFCDDHHFSAEGYRHFAIDAIRQIQLNDFDFWEHDHKSFITDFSK